MIGELFTSLASGHPVLVAFGILVVLLLCGFGFPLPEDIVLAFTGYVAYLGVMPLWLALTIGLAGVLIGDTTLWWLGKKFGRDVLKMRLFKRFLPPARLKKIQKLYMKYGMRMLFGARFTPMLRAGVFMFAGWSGISYIKFLITDGLAALISVPAIILATYIFGAEIDSAIKAVRGVEHWVLLGVIAIVLLHVLWGYIQRKRESESNADTEDEESSNQGQDSPFDESRATGTDGK